MIGIWANLGLDLAIFFNNLLYFKALMGKLCLFVTFHDLNLGLTK